MYRFIPAAALIVLWLWAIGCAPSPISSTAIGGPPLSLNLANFQKIQPGMTLEEVEAILGRPGASTGVDLKGPDGSIVGKETQSASWFWAKVSGLPQGGQSTEERRIVIYLQGGKVTEKEQMGLE
jgi:hypothetical protein